MLDNLVILNTASEAIELTLDDIKASGFEGLKKLASAGINDDLMYFRFILLHEGSNANGDYFTKDEMEAAWWTWVHKPITWEHGQPYIGFITDSVLVKPDEHSPDPRWYIECAAIIWRRRYPIESFNVHQGAKDNSFRMSMELYFRDALYALGEGLNKLYTAEEAPYLVDLVGREYQGEKVFRVFLGIHGAGAGVVANPADEDALILEVANKKGEIHVDYKQCVAHYVVYNIGDIVSEWGVDPNKEEKEENATVKTIEELEAKITELSSQLQSLESERDTYKGESEAKDATISELSTKLDTLTQEFASYKEAVETEKAEAAKDKLASERIDELVSAGVDIEEDKESLFSNLREMSEDVYATLKTVLVKNATKVVEANKKVDTEYLKEQEPAPVIEEEAEASLHDRYESMWAKVFSDERLGSELN